VTARDPHIERDIRAIVQRVVDGLFDDMAEASQSVVSPQPSDEPLTVDRRPSTDVDVIAIGADHGGFALKERLAFRLTERGYSVVDCGTDSTESVDYPEYAAAVARAVASGEAQVGIMVDGAGIGSAMVANKVSGVRAAMCYDLSTARNARDHNHANVLTLGAGLIGQDLAWQITHEFLTTPYGPDRHARRVDMIGALDNAARPQMRQPEQTPPVHRERIAPPQPVSHMDRVAPSKREWIAQRVAHRLRPVVDINQGNKHTVWRLWQDLQGTPAHKVRSVAGSALHDSVAWHGHEPLGSLQGIDGFVEGFWVPLLHSFPDLERETFVFFGGESNGRADGNVALDGHMWVTGTGRLNATFQADYLGIPASGGRISVQWGEFCRVDDGRITEVFFMLDMVELARQAGFELLPPSRGAPGIFLPPSSGRGRLLGAQDPSDTTLSLKHIRRFIFDGLNAFDNRDLASMGMAHFLAPDVKWYGPGGIGACLSFNEFETFHQTPWLVAFPDRQVQDLDALFAEGTYTGAPGWGGVLATQTGPYLGHPATGNPVGVNGLDWWRRRGGQYIENWVFVDMVHLFAQMGVDLIERIYATSP